MPEPLPDAAITAEMVDAFTVALAKAAAVPGATAGDCYRAGLEAAAPALRAQGATAERERWLALKTAPNFWRLLADLLDGGGACCDLHGRNCEPPSELCCERCTETDHPAHRKLSPCSNPDLSGNGVGS